MTNNDEEKMAKRKKIVGRINKIFNITYKVLIVLLSFHFTFLVLSSFFVKHEIKQKVKNELQKREKVENQNENHILPEPHPLMSIEEMNDKDEGFDF